MRADGIFIAGTGRWLPPTSQPIAEAIEAGLVGQDHQDLGYVSVVVDYAGVAAPDMAISAGRQAVRRSGLDPADFGLHLHAALWFQGIEYWSPASYVALQTVGPQAVAYSLDQRSCSGLGGLHLAAAYLKAGVTTAALVSTGERYAPPMDRFNGQSTTIYGDGGTALALSTRTGFARLLSTASVADNTLEGYNRGTEPFAQRPGLEVPLKIYKRYEQYAAATADERQDWARWGAGLLGAHNQALDEAGLKPGDIDYVVTPFVHRGGGLPEVHEAIGYREEQTLWTEFGRHVGHLGGGDQLAGLDYLVEQDRLRVGDRVLLFGLGMGFTFSAAVLEIVDRPSR